MFDRIIKKQKAWLLTVLLLVVIVPGNGVWAMGNDRYEWLSDNQTGYYYFDKLTFKFSKDPYFSEQYLDIWVRTQFLADGVDAEVALRRQQKLPTEAYQNLAFRMSHYWFRQKERQYQLLEVVDLDDAGKELNVKKMKYSPERWINIIPGTDYDAWQIKLLAYNQRLEEEKKNRQ